MRVVKSNFNSSADESIEAEASPSPFFAEETEHDATVELPEELKELKAEVISVSSPQSEQERVQLAQLEALLREPLDRKFIKQREGFGRNKLDYLEWHTVVRQLNRIVGVNNWSTSNLQVETYGKDEETGIPLTVTATITLTVTWPVRRWGTSSFTNVGVGTTRGGKRGYTWDAFEMAYKGAVSDALKRCAVNLGEQFGLSLYAKEEDVVDEVETPSPAAPRQQSQRQLPAPKTAVTEKQQYAPSVSPEDYNPDDDETEYCEDCEKEIHGYFSQKMNRVYTTADLVDISKRKAGGRVLCYNCQVRFRK